MRVAVPPLPAGPLPLPQLAAATPRPAIVQPPTLDRRGGPRRDPLRVVDRFTAATHRPLPLVFGLGVDEHWALMCGVSIGPAGLLARALDPREHHLEPPGRDVQGAWRRLAAHLGRERPRSPLWYSTSCVRAAGLVAALGESAMIAPVAVELVVVDGLRADGSLRLHGTLCPLADPQRDVLGIALEESDRRALEAAVRWPAAPLRPAGARAAATPRSLALLPAHEAGRPPLHAPPGPTSAPPELAAVATPGALHAVDAAASVGTAGPPARPRRRRAKRPSARAIAPASPAATPPAPTTGRDGPGGRRR